MNLMTPHLPTQGKNTTTSSPPVLTAEGVVGRKAVRGCDRKEKLAISAIPGLIDNWTDLSPGRRRDLRTAVTMLQRASGQELAAIAFTVTNVRNILAATTPAACGLSKVTFDAYRGWIRHVLKRLGLMEERRRSAAELMPDWAPLLQTMENAKAWIRLRAFLRFCSAHGVGPVAVTDAVLADYLAHLQASDIRGTARDTVRRVARAWNQAMTSVTDWPQAPLAAPVAEPRQYSLPFESYPPSLQADVEAFKARLSGANRKGLFKNGGRHLKLRPRSVATRMVSLRHAIAGLVHSGVPLERVTSLAVLVEQDNMQALLDWHHIRGGEKLGAHLGVMGATLAIVARHHVKLPPDKLEPVLNDLREVRPPKQRQMTAKNERRLRQFADPGNLGALVHLPNALFAEAERMRDGTSLDPDRPDRTPRPREAAWLAAVAVAMEILFCCPLRLANLASLRLGTHLLRLDRHGTHVTHIMIGDDETKNGDAIRWPVSAPMASAVERYVQGFRHLAGQAAAADWLFPHRDRSDIHRNAGGLANAIVDAIHRHAGLEMNVHLFRALCGSLVLEDQPEAIGDLQLLLGHRTMAVSLIFYRSRKTDLAAQRLADVLERTRKKTRLSVLGKQARGRLRRKPS